MAPLAWTLLRQGLLKNRFEDVRKIMANLGEQLDDVGLQKLIVEADHDGDGRINYEDFLLTMRAGRGVGD